VADAMHDGFESAKAAAYSAAEALNDNVDTLKDKAGKEPILFSR
jgi:hypothetical protein